MAKGKKSSIETIYTVMIGYASNRNIYALSKELNMPESTVRKIINDNKNDKKFVKLCEKKENQFIKKADEIIDKATDLLNKRINRALERENDIDKLLDEVYETPDDEISVKRKIEIAKKLSKLQLNNLNEITTAIGTMYDKRALAKGDPTSNVKVNKLEDLL